MGQHTEVFKEPGLDLVEVLRGVLVSHVGGADVELEVRPKVLKVVVVRQLVGDICAEGHSGLIGPAPRHIADGVAATAEEQQWKVVFLDKLNTLGMSCLGRGLGE